MHARVQCSAVPVCGRVVLLFRPRRRYGACTSQLGYVTSRDRSMAIEHARSIQARGPRCLDDMQWAGCGRSSNVCTIRLHRRQVGTRANGLQVAPTHGWVVDPCRRSGAPACMLQWIPLVRFVCAYDIYARRLDIGAAGPRAACMHARRSTSRPVYRRYVRTSSSRHVHVRSPENRPIES